MNTRILRMKNSKKGITPVIATIILIAVTLVLALVVGAYTFGLFGSNVKTITLTSGNLFAGSLTGTPACSTSGESYISLALNNPGATTNVTSFTLTGTSLTGAVNAYYLLSSVCTQVTSNTAPGLLGGQVTPLTMYFNSTATQVTSGQTFNYVINFKNGQSVSGTFIAQ